MNTIEYKGYLGEITADLEIKKLVGRVINTRDVITFYADTVSGLEKEMKVSVDQHLAFCKKHGVGPIRTYSGRLNLRETPDIHAKLAAKAAKAGESLNQWAIERLIQA